MVDFSALSHSRLVQGVPANACGFLSRNDGAGNDWHGSGQRRAVIRSTAIAKGFFTRALWMGHRDLPGDDMGSGIWN